MGGSRRLSDVAPDYAKARSNLAKQMGLANNAGVNGKVARLALPGTGGGMRFIPRSWEAAMARRALAWTGEMRVVGSAFVVRRALWGADRALQQAMLGGTCDSSPFLFSAKLEISWAAPGRILTAGSAQWRAFDVGGSARPRCRRINCHEN